MMIEIKIKFLTPAVSKSAPVI